MDVLEKATKGKNFEWRDHLKVHPAAELFPLMAPDELQALADDIKKNGLQTPIVLLKERSDDTPKLGDGRNRLDALALLGWLAPPRARVRGENVKRYERHISEQPLEIDDGAFDGWNHILPFQTNWTDDIYTLILSFNVHRRHLTADQKRELIAKVLKAKPEQSNRGIAKQVKADHKTVADVRKQVEATGEIPQLERTVGSDGKARKLPALRKQPKRRLQAALAAVGAYDDPQASAATRKAEYAGAGVIDQLFNELPKGPGQTVENFDTLIAALLCQIKGKRPQDFAKTTVAQPLLRDLVHFLREVVTVRKLVAETVADDAAASAEQRKAEYAAGDGGQ